MLMRRKKCVCVVLRVRHCARHCIVRPPRVVLTHRLPYPLDSQANISSVPTFISFVDGKAAEQFSGANAASLVAAAEKLAK